MKWFYDMKIGMRLQAVFAITGLITVLVGFVGISGMGKIADMSAASYAKETLGILHLQESNVDLIYVARDEKNLLLSSTPEQRERYRSAIEKDKAQLDRNMDEARPLIHTDKGKGAVAKVRPGLEGAEGGSEPGGFAGVGGEAQSEARVGGIVDGTGAAEVGCN
jgi:methyl-accepting chemotaxis protein